MQTKQDLKEHNNELVQEGAALQRTIRQLEAQLAAAQARIAELEARCVWEPVEEGESVKCACGNDSCGVRMWVDNGDINIRNATGVETIFYPDDNHALCRKADL